MNHHDHLVVGLLVGLSVCSSIGSLVCWLVVGGSVPKGALGKVHVTITVLVKDVFDICKLN